jgi:urease gamma subunit
MDEFDAKTVKAMRAAVEEVCRHIPADSVEAKSFVATRILECARQGERTHTGLLAAGRRAVIDQFGTIAR